MTIMVALVGEQPMPNLLPARHYHLDGILLVYTQRTRSVCERLKAVLQRETAIYELETDAYNIAEIARRLSNRLAESDLISRPLVFNLTGGTKTMSLAAYQVAQQRNAPFIYMESERKSNRVYRYTWENHGLIGDSSELIPECITLKDLFDVQLGPGAWTEEGASQSVGGLFEAAIAQSLRSHGFEVMTGIKSMGGQLDVDVAIRVENQFGIIEAKIDKKARELDGIKQLSTNVRHLGTYMQTFYVINVERNKVHDALAEASRIRVTSLTHYASGSFALTSEDAETLITAAVNALRGG